MISAAGNCLSASSKEGSGSPGGEERCLDSQLWHACAGGMVQMPQVNSSVFYFPQGQAEHAQGDVDFGANCSRIPPLILCRVVAVKFNADPDTDEVYARIRLLPLRKDDPSAQPEDDGGEGGGCFGDNSGEASEKPASFAKSLTQSDANNGGGFSVPRYCAETIFPRLDYSADPPVQTVLAKDVHGEVWKFRHIYRGTPRRHLLTTGWSTFVNQKRLVAGDSIVFLRTANGELCVGIRRATRGESSSPSGWNPVAGSYGYGGMGIGMGMGAGIGGRGGGGGGGEGGGFLVEERKKGKGRGRVSPESVLESASLAAKGLGFEVVYYPRASTPEFCVRESAVRSAMRVQWTAGMRFKMAFETEDSSRISWFMGTISGVQVADPIRWPNSPWRLLQVTWDEPDLLQNVKRVSPWLVEVVSNMPSIQLMPFPPQKKKLRLPQHMDFPLENHPHIAAFSGSTFRSSSPLQCIVDNSPAGIQGARHGQFGFSLSDFHLNKLQSGLFQDTCQQHGLGALSAAAVSTELFMGNSDMKDNVSCSLAIGVSPQSADKTVETKPAEFLLFGKPILRVTDPAKLGVSSADGTGRDSSLLKEDCLADVKSEKVENYPVEFFDSGMHQQKPLNPLPCQGLSLLKGRKNDEISLGNGEYKKAFEDYASGHCKVFMESENVGRTLDLSVVCSYEDLYRRLADMFGIERLEVLSNVLYRDASGVVKHTGEEPFSEFTKTARRLTILSDSSNMGK